MADGPTLHPAGDWTAAVEGAVRAEVDRGRRWLRLILGLSILLMVATLVLLAIGVIDVADLRRSVPPIGAATQRLESGQGTLAQRQAEIDRRLRAAEAELARLTQELKASPPPAAEPAPRRRVAGPGPLERRVAEMDRRLQRVESAASAAEVDRARIDGRLNRLDEAVGRLGAAIGPQSAP